MTSSDILCIRFSFGVPLEDIFPPDDIHPRLHNLFYQTTLALEDNLFPIHRLLSNNEVSLGEVFELKDALTYGKLLYKEPTSPSSFFWLIRHFLGLLPIPLFPRFTDKVTYNWEYLATQCQLDEMEPSYQLIADISWWLHKLPQANVMLIYALIGFLRKICLKAGSTKKLNLESVIAVTTYFSSSLFYRPYRPGTVSITDSLYYPLLGLIILNWRKIRKYKKPEPTRMEAVSWEEPTSSSIKVYNAFLKTWVVDIGCQTSSCLLQPIPATETQPNVAAGPDTISQHAQTENDSKIYMDCGTNTLTPPEEEEEPKKTPETPVYEEIRETKLSDVDTSSQTVIYKNDNFEGQKFLSSKVLKQQLSKANRSLVNAISKIKSNQEVNDTKLETPTKYTLLKDSSVTKVQSLHVNVKDSTNIKYKKLMTL